MEIDNIESLASRLSVPQKIDLDAEHAIALVPEGWGVQDISNLLPPPSRIKQGIELLTLDAFTGYVAKFKTADSAVFADESAARYEAVLDYHHAGVGSERGTCDHIARYTCPQSDQWKLWTGKSGSAMSQVDFARFLEDNLPDITTPPAADFLALVLQLQIHKAASFVSDIRLDNGQTRLRYEETIRNDTKQGDLQIPDAFVINAPVFVDGARYALKCRLRYRLDESKLRMWYELERPVDVFRAAVKEVSDKVRKTLADVSFWAGKRTA
jgi:uncharacterized protein YfdQ (DUF2303 family)